MSLKESLKNLASKVRKVSIVDTAAADRMKKAAEAIRKAAKETKR